MKYDNFNQYFNKFIKSYKPYQDSSFYLALVKFLQETYFKDSYEVIPSDLKHFLEDQIISSNLYDVVLRSIGFPESLLDYASNTQKELLLKNFPDYVNNKGTKASLEKIISVFNEKANVYELLYNFDTKWYFSPYLIYKDDQLSQDKSQIDFRYITNQLPRFLVDSDELSALKTNDKLILPIKSNIILLDSSEQYTATSLDILIYTILLSHFKDNSITLYLSEGTYIITLKGLLSLWIYLLIKRSGSTYEAISITQCLLYDHTLDPFPFVPGDLSTIITSYNNIDSRVELDNFYSTYLSQFAVADLSFDKVDSESLEFDFKSPTSYVGMELITVIENRLNSSTNIASEIKTILTEIRSSFMTWAKLSSDDILNGNLYNNKHGYEYILRFLDSTSSMPISKTSFVYKLVELLKPFHTELVNRYKITVKDKFDQVYMDDNAVYYIGSYNGDNYEIDSQIVYDDYKLPTSSCQLITDYFLSIRDCSGTYTFDDTKIVQTDSTGIDQFDVGDYIFSPGSDSSDAVVIESKDTSTYFFTLASLWTGVTGVDFSKAYKCYFE